jgi:hypothetical protein
MDCSTKDVNGSIHKTKKWIVPQKQKNGSFHKNKKEEKLSTEKIMERFVDE